MKLNLNWKHLGAAATAITGVLVAFRILNAEQASAVAAAIAAVAALFFAPSTETNQ